MVQIQQKNPSLIPAGAATLKSLLKTSTSASDNIQTARTTNGAQSSSKDSELNQSKAMNSSNNKKTLTVLHYNDVYNIDQNTMTEPIGGAARFCTAIKSFQHLNPLVLFSGDAFNPSMLSTFTKGEQMIPVLNAVGTHCAVFGNHDFDHGLDVLENWVSRTTFPWLMSNVIDQETGRPLGNF